ncbi:hypothetical protein [Actinomadura sp. 3N407]|uniref:hypothetical protein n=1 Tax=Actinomadura sp. 3N407 TaxID=3457423 RepID=UPI003FCD67B8
MPPRNPGRPTLRPIGTAKDYLARAVREDIGDPAEIARIAALVAIAESLARIDDRLAGVDESLGRLPESLTQLKHAINDK